MSGEVCVSCLSADSGDELGLERAGVGLLGYPNPREAVSP
jgi:hypothetical protein